MKIAVEGCAHGELDKIYEVLKHLELQNNIKVDLLIICGDFQSVRNNKDLSCMAVSQKYRKLNTFYKYHSGEKVAPVLTIFIGGNHEASNYLSELFYGGWVCPKIYYLGRAGVINVGGVRIAGLSGIFKGHDYLKGHYEHYPFSEDTKRSVYHVRNLEVFRLKQLKKPIDIIISHDWPRGVYNYGNTRELLRQKKFFRQEVESNTLGSRPAEDLLKEMKPAYWFAAHLHCKFAAVVPHTDSPHEQKFTKFLALDKCLPRRKFLQVVDIGAPVTEDSCVVLEHDPEWLAVLRATNHLLNLTRQTQFMPGPGAEDRWDFSPSEAEKKEVTDLLGDLVISPDLFQRTAPSHSAHPGRTDDGPFPWPNPQTLRLTKALGLTDPAVALAPSSESTNQVFSESLLQEPCSDEDANSDQEETGCSSLNPEEISLDDEKLEEEPGVEGLFVIDRKRSFESRKKNSDNNETFRSERSKLSLSCPKNSSMSSSEINSSDFLDDLEILSSGGMEKLSPESGLDKLSQSSVSTLEKLSQVSVVDSNNFEASPGSDVSKKRQSDGDDASETLPAVKRTMKRRNQALYCSTEDDE